MLAERKEARKSRARMETAMRRGLHDSARWSEDKARAADQRADFHARAVQALNELFPEVDDTAERDHTREKKTPA
jgi:hypothetical protein